MNVLGLVWGGGGEWSYRGITRSAVIQERLRASYTRIRALFARMRIGRLIEDRESEGTGDTMRQMKPTGGRLPCISSRGLEGYLYNCARLYGSYG